MENSCDASEISLEEEMQQMYIVNRQLGQGAFGKVFECKDPNDGRVYAVKVIEKNSVKKSKIDSLREEAKIMSGISHPNVVKLYSMHETELRFYLRMELIQHGTLAKLMQDRVASQKPFREDQIAQIMRAIFEGVGYLHSVNIIHRDLKPQNILVTHPDDLSNLKITDFGLSTQLDSQFPRSVTLQCGTLIYMAPEILFRYTYTKSVDIYSCSIIMYMLFHQGRHPIYTSKMTADEYKKLLLHAKFPPLQGQERAIDGLRLAQNLMDKVSKYEALERYNVVETLKHPWITRRFNDQIPLSIYESFMSFENTQRVLLLIRLSFILSCQQLQPTEIPDISFYDMAYLERCQHYSQIGIEQRQKRNIDKRDNKKKISSTQQIKEMVSEIEKEKRNNRQIKKVEEVYNQKHPKIEKLNSMFSHLFQKKSKHNDNSKPETMANLVSFEESLAVSTKQWHNPQQPQPQCKQKIQQQIEKSVKDFKDKVNHNSRRIFSRNNLKRDIKLHKPETLPVIHSKTSMGDHTNFSTNEHDSSFKSSDKAVMKVSSGGSRGRQLRNCTTLKIKEPREVRYSKKVERKPSVNLRRS